MSLSIPTQLTVPFADAGLRTTIPAASNNTTGRAGYDQGFPPINMVIKAAGGIPPFGQDMNGILYAVTLALRYLEAGGAYVYDTAFSTAIGGYNVGARVLRTDGLGYWLNTIDANTTNPESAGAAAAGWVPDYTNGVTAVTMTNANVTLTPVQYGKPIIVITGLLTANLNLIFPAISGQWVVQNKTTGAFSITCKTASGSGVVVSIAGNVFGDGTNIYFVQSPSSTNKIIISASGSYVKPAGLRAIYFEMQGPGSGGGASQAAATTGHTSLGSGGGGGGWVSGYILASSLSASETVTIGAAGIGGATSGASGGTAGLTSFGTHATFTAPGAGSGGGVAGAATTRSSSGGAAGSASAGGSVLGARWQVGQPGAFGFRYSDGVAVGCAGGDSYWGFGGPQVTEGAGGQSGANFGYGGGGGGGTTGATGTSDAFRVGGAGGPGRLEITEIF